jgi:hypothetical protein
MWITRGCQGLLRGENWGIMFVGGEIMVKCGDKYI